MRHRSSLPIYHQNIFDRSSLPILKVKGKVRSNSRGMRHQLTINGNALRPYDGRRFCAILYISIRIRPIASQISIFASVLCDSIYEYTVYDRLLLFCAIIFASLVPIPEVERQRRFFSTIHSPQNHSSVLSSIFPPGLNIDFCF
ncbi:hypothetical protein L6452_21827 [Arctium lappa]|uniref:Uncharacterized protein n=1 Tax=Arctium lappa TaxID=4217 RepID=A0ACB9AYD1_ARCLA|nr:hypothetical protein L6452_21827 [Arctium lappa]